MTDSPDCPEAPSPDWTFARFLAWWLVDSRPRQRPSTVRHYRTAVARYGEWLGDRPIGSITRSDLQACVDRHVAEGAAAGTVRTQFGAIARAMRIAFEDRIIDRNPAPAVRKPAVPVTTTPSIQGEQLEAFMRAALAPAGVGGREWFGPMLACAVLTGLRTGELRGLRWADVDMSFDGDAPAAAPPRGEVADIVTSAAVGLIHVTAQIAQDSHAAEWTALKTEQGKRSVPINGYVHDILLAQHERVGRQVTTSLRRLPSGAERWTENDLVFPGRRGKPAHPKSIFEARHLIAARAGLETTPTFHALRHAYVSMLIDAGVPTATVAKLVGHADSRLTEAVYFQVTGRGMDTVARALDGRNLRAVFSDRPSKDDGKGT